ncbi:MAG: hypothetical protein JSV03_09270 [Planctomycetota bacterium]|nr:MAG: hypothetical protein JSV03_09270 [Planctomycetota bacterium]
MPVRSDHYQRPEPDDPEAVSTCGMLPRIVVTTQSGQQNVLWMVTVLLAVVATALIMRWDEARLTETVYAQVPGAGQVGARGIYAFTGQLSSKNYGLFMLDVDTGTIWCYELQKGTRGELQLKLVAARSWIWDRYLEEFNVADPIPGAVRAMVEQQRSHRQELLETPE